MCRYTTYGKWVTEKMLRGYDPDRINPSRQEQMFEIAYKQTVKELQKSFPKIMRVIQAMYVQKIPMSEIQAIYDLTKQEVSDCLNNGLDLLSYYYGFGTEKPKKFT